MERVKWCRRACCTSNRCRNQAMAWGVVVKNGLAYVNDNHNGLWIVRIEPPRDVAQ